jgi:glycerophosphoryl diester phosphodiesterase
VILQTFGEETARTLARMTIGVPVVLLIGQGDGWDRARVASWKGTVQGLAPAKQILLQNPAFVTWAHAEGLTVTPYTFRAADPGTFPTVSAEMEHYLYTLGVDALFTDNPDLFPHR